MIFMAHGVTSMTMRKAIVISPSAVRQGYGGGGWGGEVGVNVNWVMVIFYLQMQYYSVRFIKRVIFLHMEKKFC